MCSLQFLRVVKRLVVLLALTVWLAPSGRWYGAAGCLVAAAVPPDPALLGWAAPLVEYSRRCCGALRLGPAVMSARSTGVSGQIASIGLEDGRKRDEPRDWPSESGICWGVNECCGALAYRLA